MLDLIQNIGIGAIIGFLATIIGSFGLYFKRELDKKERLRAALITEIENMEEMETIGEDDYIDYLKKEDYAVLPKETFNTTIYENNASKLGLLEREEIEAIIEYYTSLKVLRSYFDSYEFGNEIPEHTLYFIDMLANDIEDHRESALNILKDKQN